MSTWFSFDSLTLLAHHTWDQTWLCFWESGWNGLKLMAKLMWNDYTGKKIQNKTNYNLQPVRRERRKAKRISFWKIFSDCFTIAVVILEFVKCWLMPFVEISRLYIPKIYSKILPFPFEYSFYCYKQFIRIIM